MLGLMMKPPLRFLHDAVTPVIKDIWVLNRPFKEHKMHSNHDNDKAGHIKFPVKTIGPLSFALSEPSSVAKHFKIYVYLI